MGSNERKRRLFKRQVIGILGALVLLAVVLQWYISLPDFSKEARLRFSTAAGYTRDFVLKVAADDGQRTKGLMFVRELPDGEGMLFIWPGEEPRSFWMKNTIVPLDIIFAAADGTVLNVAAHTKPFSEEGVPSAGAAKYVVELVAGSAKKYGIETGSKLEILSELPEVVE